MARNFERFFSGYAPGNAPRYLHVPEVSGPPQTHWLDLERSSAQYASITDAAQNGALDITGALTIEARIKPESGAGVFNTLVSKLSGSSQRSYILRLTTSQQLDFIVCETGASATDYRATTTTTIADGVEVHVAAVFTPSVGSTIYVDGVAQSLTTSGSPPASIHNGTLPFEIGAQNALNQYDGLIADVRIWNVARTAGEVAGNASVDVDPETAGIVGYWYKSDSHEDLTANGNDLTATNAPVFVSYP